MGMDTEANRRPYYGDLYEGSYGARSGGQHGIAVMLHKSIGLLRRRWLSVLLSVLLGLSWVGYKLWVTPKRYRATSLIQMQARRPRLLQSADAVLQDRSHSWQGSSLINTRLERFRGPRMREKAIAYLTRIGDECPMNISAPSFSPRKNSFLVQISCTHTSPERSAVSANAYAMASQEMMFDENKESSRQAVVWLQEQAEVQRKALDEASQQHIKFMKDNDMDVLESRSKTAVNTVSVIGSRLASLQNDMFLAKDLHETLTSMSRNFEETGSIPTTAPNSTEIHSKIQLWRQAVSERKALQLKYREQHPDMIAATATVASTRSTVEDAIKRMVDTARANLALQEQQVKSLETKMRAQQELAAELGLELARLKGQENSLMRTQQAADVSHRGLLRRIEEARLSADENTTTVSIIRNANTPRVPFSPRADRLLMTGLVLGLMAGLGLAFLKEILDDPITSASDIEASLGLRVLGVIPQRKRETRQEIARESSSKISNLISEAFAGIRAILRSVQYREESKSLLVTSTAPGDGKTIVACNLAISCARHGDRTLLIDFDLRRPRIHRIFPEAEISGGGVAEELLIREFDEDMAKTLVRSTDCANLDVAVSLPVEKDASATEVVAKPAVRHFLEWAKANYDQIIIDSPPQGVISDASVLAGETTGVILVCWADRSRKHSLEHAAQHLAGVGANIIGVVINAVKRDIGSGVGRYNYYHGEYDTSKYA